MADSNNLLVRLHRWVHRQDENFTTEAFVHVLQRLLDHEPQAAARFLKHLTGGVVDLRPEEVLEVHLRTQITTAGGRPDVEIRTKRRLVYVEAKVESGLGYRQLERYREGLLKSGFPITTLVLLTRYPVVLNKLGDNPDHCVRWHGLTDWLRTELAGTLLRDAVSRHVVEQFIGFLSARGMTMEQVGPEMVSGVQALRNFVSMLAEAASACKLTVKPCNTTEYVGFYLRNKQYWIGLSYDTPGILQIHTHQFCIDRARVTKLDKGCTWEAKWALGGLAWQLGLDLQDEEVHFFALDRASQMQCLEKFIREFLEDVKMIEAADQPATTATDLADDSMPFANETKG